MSRGADWIHPPTRVAIVWFRDGGRCLVCGWKPEVRFGAGLALDHLIPTSRFAEARYYHSAHRPEKPHAPNNLATLCTECNEKKGDRLPEEAFPARVAKRLWERARRPLKKWHRRRGYLAAVRAGRYRRARNAARCKANREVRKELAYRAEERQAIVDGPLFARRPVVAEPWS